MDADRFAKSPVGHLTPIRGTDGRTGEEYDHVAFVPSPLGVAPVLSRGTWQAITRAHYALGRLQQATRQVASPLLHRPTLRREAQSTSALEGTFAPLEDVLAADVIDESERSAELKEVVNYITTAEAAFEWVGQERPLTVGLLRDLHRTLVRGTDADTDQAGQIRAIQVAIGSRGGSIVDARFVPPPPGLELEAAVRDFLDWLNNPQPESDPVVNGALAHYQFETLHPFNDGNGRIGRLLVVLQFMQEKLLSDPTLTVSPWFETRRTAYQDALAGVSGEGDWDSWVAFFAKGIEAAATDTTSRVSQILRVQESFQQRLRDANAKGIVRDVAEGLTTSPYITIAGVAASTGKSFQAASNAVTRLVELGILSERTGRSHHRLFAATEVVDVLVR